MKHRLTKLLAWAQKNERHLGAVLFVFGFITDLVTFAILPVQFVNLAFVGYLLMAFIATLGSHLFSGAREHATAWRRVLSIVFPLAAQYAIGSLLSGFLIFYTKSASVIVSWPFLLLLVLVFIGNEYFRTYYKHLAFQVILFFFSLYAYSIFAVPLVLHQLGSKMFGLSTLVSLVAFAIFLFILFRLRRASFFQSMRYVLPATAAIVLVMTTAYFTGLIPPIPLTLPEAGVYHSVRHEGDHYVVELENEAPWANVLGTTIHRVPGEPLYGFSSVAAPYDFDTFVVHDWERYNPATHHWEEYARIAFIITGGRDGGYRGYSVLANPPAGKWRLTIETKDRQVVGRRYFTIEDTDTPPLIKEETR